MPLTQEQLDQIEFSKQQGLSSARMEAVRIARDVLAENDRNKPVGERGVTAEDITSFAETIVAYVNR